MNTHTKRSSPGFDLLAPPLAGALAMMAIAVLIAGEMVSARASEQLRTLEVRALLFDRRLHSRHPAVYPAAADETVVRPYFAGRLTELLDSNGHLVRRSALAHELGIRYQDLLDMERGVRPFDAAMRRKICRIYLRKDACFTE